MVDISDESIDLIPSESSIQVAKERRKRLQTTGPENDYISLSLTVREKDDQGPHPESRLVREEDELGEGDDGVSYRRQNSLSHSRRVCRVHKRSREDCPRQKIYEKGSYEAP